MKANRLQTITLAVLFAVAAPLSAQQHTNQSRGFDPRGVFQVSDIDAINLFNGALTVTIPLGPRFPVGPTDYGFALVYNSNAWSVREVCPVEGINFSTISSGWLQIFCPTGQPNCSDIQRIYFYIPPLTWGTPEEDHAPRQGTDCRSLSLPNPVSNAGLGWQLNFGKLLPRRENEQDRSPNVNESEVWLYVGADGSEHSFDQQDGSHWKTSDGAFLRLRETGGCGPEAAGCQTVDLPDGGAEIYQDFPGSSGPDWRLISRKDRFGNGFTVQYTTPLEWLVSDTEGRHHVIELAIDSANFQPVIKRLLLEATHSKTLEVLLEHEVRSVPRAAPHNDPTAGPNVAAPLLEHVRLQELGSTAELSRWSMSPVEAAYFFQDDPGPVFRPVQVPGVLRSLELPTGARIGWTFGGGYRYPNGAGGRRNVRTTTGVRVRTVTDVDGSTIGRWTYQPQLTLLEEATYSTCGTLGGSSGFPPFPYCHEKRFQNAVTDPTGTKTVHHFSVYPLPSNSDPASEFHTPEGWERGDYGLPFSRHESLDGMFLSTEVFPDSTSPAVRKTYVRYENDGGDLRIDGWGADTRNNHRPAATRTVYLDDPVQPVTTPPQYRYRESVSSNYAGFGRYRRTEQRSGGGWPSGSGQAEGHRIEFTDWQPDEVNWVADRFTRRSVREGSRQEQVEYRFEPVVGDRGFAPTATRRLANDTVSGPISEDRTMAPSSKDILTHLEYDSHGNVTRETSWGADRQSLPPVRETEGSLFQPPTDRAGALVRHAYTAGVRSKTEILDPCRGANAVVLKVLDLTIDSRSGLPTASQDVADVSTTFAYDALGRLLEENPAGTAKTIYQHLLRGSSTPPPVGNGAQVIATTGSCCDHYRRARWHYDGLGRLVHESRDFPAIDGTAGGSATANRFYEYNGLGWSTAESTWRYGGADFTGIERALEVANGSTKYSQFDAFGRAGRITPPEGSQHDVVVSRTGDRLVTTTAKVATGANGQETAVSRTEEYDVFGRLVAVKEPSGPNGAVVTSSYRYDAGNRLIEVGTTSGTVTQTRSFDYDGLGFLRQEVHPELGVSGNGALKLDFYDVRGNVGTREIAGLTPQENRRGLDYRYDAAGRLVEVFDLRFVIERQPTQPPLQQYFYATVNTEGSFQKGKLVRTRQRHPETGLWVAEDFVYQGLGGRMSSRGVKLTGGPNGSPRFSQTMSYTQLGELASLSYPQCQSTESSCRQATEALGRTIDLVYKRGLPWGVTMAVTTAPEAEPTISGLAGPILYSAHGGVRQIPHANGVTDTVTNDPKGQARPLRIAFQKPGSAHWDSGTFQYDGAGNLWGLGAAGEPVPQQRFQYDGVGRLVDGQVRRQGQATLSREQIAYDAFGNWTGRAVNSVGIPVPQVNPATNRLTGEGVNYDASGNLLQWSPTSSQLKFDLLDRVIERKDGPTTWQYLYTASGERVIEKNAATGLERWTLRGPDNQVLRTMERQPSGQWSVLRDNLFAGRRLLAAHSPAGLHHFHLDHLGSVRLETDAAGNPIKYRDFLPFGESLETGGGTENRLLYTGHQRDDMATPTTADDLDYMHARYCSPTFGRFLSVDPVLGKPARPQSWNRYSYVASNPLNAIDPTGMESAQIRMDNLVNQLQEGEITRDEYMQLVSPSELRPVAWLILAGAGGVGLAGAAPVVPYVAEAGAALAIKYPGAFNLLQNLVARTAGPAAPSTVNLGPGAASAGSFVTRIVNSNMGHAATRAVERAGFKGVREATQALRAFGERIEAAGQFPANAIVDPARANRVIVPGFGNGGAVVYQSGSDGTFKLKTVLEWISP